MEIIILYWLFSTFYAIGIDFYKGYRLRTGGVIFSILFGWIILPISLGTKRGKEIEGL